MIEIKIGGYGEWSTYALLRREAGWGQDVKPVITSLVRGKILASLDALDDLSKTVKACGRPVCGSFHFTVNKEDYDRWAVEFMRLLNNVYDASVTVHYYRSLHGLKANPRDVWSHIITLVEDINQLDHVQVHVGIERDDPDRNLAFNYRKITDICGHGNYYRYPRNGEKTMGNFSHVVELPRHELISYVQGYDNL